MEGVVRIIPFGRPGLRAVLYPHRVVVTTQHGSNDVAAVGKSRRSGWKKIVGFFYFLFIFIFLLSSEIDPIENTSD